MSPAKPDMIDCWNVVFDRDQAPDQAFRDECVKEAFSPREAAWNQWASGNKNVWENLHSRLLESQGEGRRGCHHKE